MFSAAVRYVPTSISPPPPMSHMHSSPSLYHVPPEPPPHTTPPASHHAPCLTPLPLPHTTPPASHHAPCLIPQPSPSAHSGASSSPPPPSALLVPRLPRLGGVYLSDISRRVPGGAYRKGCGITERRGIQEGVWHNDNSIQYTHTCVRDSNCF